MSVRRDKRQEMKAVKAERFIKFQEEVSLQRCRDVVKKHQDKARQLFNQHKQSISKKQASPGPGQYFHGQNIYTNSFTGEGASASFGTGPRLPAPTSLTDRTMALQRMQNRKTSVDSKPPGNSCKSLSQPVLYISLTYSIAIRYADFGGWCQYPKVPNTGAAKDRCS